MHVYVVRHTEYENPDGVFAFHLPLPLSKSGQEHAAEIGDWFQQHTGKGIKIFSSPILRTVQTAEAIADKTNSEIQTDDRLIETQLPDLQGQAKPEGEKWKLEEDHPARESREDVLKRMLDIFNEKVEAGEDCVLVTHGDASTLFYFHLHDKKVPQYLWSPDVKDQVVLRGDILDVEVEDGEVRGVERVRIR